MTSYLMLNYCSFEFDFVLLHLLLSMYAFSVFALFQIETKNKIIFLFMIEEV